MASHKAEIDKLIEDALAKVTPRALHRVLFNLANSYNMAAQLAIDKGTSSNNLDFAAPAIMCRSFAIELLLKFFIVVKYPTANTKADLDTLGVDLRGHRYSALFDQIKDEHQMLIAKTYSDRSDRPTNTCELRNLLIALGDGLFVAWRYIYKASGIAHLDMASLTLVADSLGFAAQDITRSLAK